jgi:YVTN family beta-propeller protein
MIPAAMRRPLPMLVAIAVLAVAAIALARADDPGVIGPQNGIQPSGRKLDPVGDLTKLGNLPAGAALTAGGRFAWTLSAGRGFNDIRIVRVGADPKCRKAGRPRRCRRRSRGKVVQKIPMPGVSGGIAIDTKRDVAYVSGVPESDDAEVQVGDEVPGQEGDVIHVFEYDRRTGEATRDGVIEVPPPPGTPPPQAFPPTVTDAISWPRDLALSPDGGTLLAALNLAHRAAIIDTESREVRYVATGRYPYGAAISRDGKQGFVSNEADGTVSVIDLAAGQETDEITVGPHLSHPEGIATDPREDRIFVAVAHQDLIAVVDTDELAVERTLSVERRQGIGSEPTQVSVTSDGCRLMSADSGEDAVAVFAISGRPACGGGGGGSRHRAERILEREAQRGGELAESEEGS